MAATYIFATVTIIALHLDQLLPALKSVFRVLLQDCSQRGGFCRATCQMAIPRYVEFNESGLLICPNLSSSASTHEPVEGLISFSTGPYDTVIIRSLTGLSLLVSGEWMAGAPVPDLRYAYRRLGPVGVHYLNAVLGAVCDKRPFLGGLNTGERCLIPIWCQNISIFTGSSCLNGWTRWFQN